MDRGSISLTPGRFLVGKAVYAIIPVRVGNEEPLSVIWAVVGNTLSLAANFSGNAVRRVYMFQVAGLLGNIRKGQFA